jgi:hypothetical protein
MNRRRHREARPTWISWTFIAVSAIPSLGLIAYRVIRLALYSWQAILTDYVIVPGVVSWLIIVFCFWVGIGDGTSAHHTNFSRYKSLWVVFALITLVAFLGANGSYYIVDKRVSGLQGKGSLLSDAISRGKGLKTRIGEGLDQSLELKDRLQKQETFDKLEIADVHAIQSLVRDLGGNILQVNGLAVLAFKLAEELNTTEKDLVARGGFAQITAFAQ